VEAADVQLDLEVFEGPFDLLLALVLREEVELVEVPVAEIVVAYLELAAARDEVDLESATEFLLLVSTLLELKARLLFDREGEDDDELTPEAAGAELLERLVEYRRFQGAAGWLRDRLDGGPRAFRQGPAPLAPRPVRDPPARAEDPRRLAAALDRLLTPPEQIELSHVRRRVVPLEHYLERLRLLLSRRRAFDFDDAVDGLDRLGQASAFLALLELVKAGEAVARQGEPFAPIRVAGTAAADEGRAIA
jgi:segregation and condensation protein A